MTVARDARTGSASGEPARSSVPIRQQLKELAAERRRFAWGRLKLLLEREGIRMNHMKLRRLYAEERLQPVLTQAVRDGGDEIGRTEKHRSTEPRNTVTMGVAATQHSTFEWWEFGAQVNTFQARRLPPREGWPELAAPVGACRLAGATCRQCR